MPFQILSFLFNFIKDNVGEEIKAIGAVNCFYRPPSGSLIDDFTGTNTDGEAAIEPIKRQLTESQNLNIGLLGYGGAGKAILAFLLREFKSKQKNHSDKRVFEKVLKEMQELIND